MESTVDTLATSPAKTGQFTDHERGRKRRRSSANLPPASHSTNLRGRARRRSVSPSSTQNTPEKKGRFESYKPPGRKFQKISIELEQERKRSPSPSRSRCAGDREKDSPPRRRQRTTSRSRNHDEDIGDRNEDDDGNEKRIGDVIDDIAVKD